MNVINDLHPHTYVSQNNALEEDDNTISNDNVEVDESSMPREEHEKFERLLKQAQRELYPGCEGFSVLTAIVEFMHGKVMFGMSNTCYDYFMALFKRMLPKDNVLPPSHYEADKILKDLGLGCEKIHACKYDCVLFYKENKALDQCPVCNEPRYHKSSPDKKRKIPRKVLRYFPLKPRLQRLYMSVHTANAMRWHKEKRVDDDVMRHPADGIAWKEFDNIYPDFAADPRNVRLGLATDGFNPFNNMSKPYSMWPVVVVPYNFPPWRCMKKEFSIMTLLIPGDKAPGREIDVYLRPLIDELKELWENGVPTYDKATNYVFNLRAALMWTINDFPAYANLSGWGTKGYNACPVCNEDGTSKRFSDKICYMGHRRWLPWNHAWRDNKDSFDGRTEYRARPREFSGEEILAQVANLNFGRMGKHDNNPDKKMKKTPEHRNWSKNSVFFELEYWSKLKIRHNLDVMHIEKNVSDSVVGTILDLEGKSKDTHKARNDLMNLGIKENLWLEWDGSKWNKGHPFYTVEPKFQKEFLEFLKWVKYPDGYAASISRNVKVGEKKISGLKHHDCHVLLQRLIPVGIRKFLPENVVEPIIELSSFFQQICAKTLCVVDLERLKENIVYILCKLEQIFPPAFFDVMIHVMIHLVDEAILAGPVNFRWMYPIERLLGRYKRYVQNKAHPKGSITAVYLSNESLTFCGMYLRNVESSFNRRERNIDGGVQLEKLSVFAQIAKLFMGSSSVEFTSADMKIVEWFIFNNCDEVTPFLEEHEEIIKRESSSNVEQRHKDKFPSWFREHMRSLGKEKSPLYNDELFELVRGVVRAETYQGCVVNGVKFVVAERDDRLITQNSGVYVPGDVDTGELEFYGKLTSVIELLYRQGYKVVLFKCHWFNTNPSRRGSIKRDYHLISVNTNTRWYDNDPYILATQAKQVFYVADPKAGTGWKVIQRIQHRNVWDIPEKGNSEGDSSDDDVTYQENSSSDIPDMAQVQHIDETLTPYCLENVPPVAVEIDSIIIDLGALPRIDENEFIYNYNEESSIDTDDYISNEENSSHGDDSSSSTTDDDSDLDY
ncbi:hypothetical protein ACFX15_008273 [Malus domestica]